MTISDQGVQLIASFEGLKLSPYLDSAKIPTIGFGSTYLLNGTRVTMETKPITKEEALALLKKHVQQNEKVMRLYIKYNCNQNQWDALSSLVYNIGSGNFQKSTLLKELNKGNVEECARHFMDWVYAGKVKLKGLVNRRTAEQKYFLQ